MTCVVGIVAGRSVVMGADSAGVAGDYRVSRRDPKVFRRGGLLFGFTTSFRMGQLLESRLKVPELPTRRSDLRSWARNQLIDAVRATLKEGGWLTVKDTRETGGTFLVGVRGQLLEVEDDFQVGEPADGFAAIGCGFAYALGSLDATKGTDPRKRVAWALRAAARFSTGVAPPFRVLVGA